MRRPGQAFGLAGAVALCLVAGLASGGCRSVDDGLLPAPDDAGSKPISEAGRRDARVHDAARSDDAGREPGAPASDAGRDAGGVDEHGCRQNPDTDDEVCRQICPEVCNDEDDDCDRRIDEDATGCALAHAASVCQRGQCLITRCAPGHRDCDGKPANGCEVVLATDEAHCGACGHECAIAHADASCVGGDCVVDACHGGWDDCDAEPLDCETETVTAEDCGACGVPCQGFATASRTCKTGTCEIRACLGNADDCNDDAADGCETPLDTLTDCGGCDVPCDKANCAGGVCSTAVCVGSLADCDGDEMDCETDLSSDLAHCGGCLTACGFQPGDPHGALACESSVCAAVCDPGWDDCDADYTSGCETAVDTVAQCGACGFDCDVELVHTTATTCNATTFDCEIATCQVGFADCDATDATGCEIDLHTTTDCGGCSASGANEPCTGLPQATTTSCVTGTCAVTGCEGGFDDCDGMAANGCEHDVTEFGPCEPDTNCTLVTRAGHDYFFCTNGGDWLASRDKCRLQLGGDLVTIDDDTENAFVKGQLVADAWLGANDRTIESRWAWSADGVLLWQGTAGGMALLGSYTNWASGEPNAAAAGDDCARMRVSDGAWLDLDCETALDFVCERMPDECPANGSKYYAGQCGCMSPDVDADGDGFALCNDGCPGDSQKSAPGMCNCGTSDTDTDLDGAADCIDACPMDPLKTALGLCGCGVSDVNSDGDAQPDCLDLCPKDAAFVTHCPRMRITVDPAQVDATLTDFPVLVRITNASLIGARADGLDLFFSATGGATPLPFEIEQWTQATGTLVAWVRLPTVNDLTDTVFYLRYGDGSSTNRASPTGVWTSDYRAVYHMQYGGGAGTQTDSTTNANHASPDTGSCAAAAPVGQVSGIIGKALTFGADACDRLIANDANSLDIISTLTISAWIRPTTSGTAATEAILSKRIRVTEATNYQVGLWNPHNMYFMWGTGNMWPPIYVSSPAAAPTTNAWSHVVWTVQGAPKGMRTYLNGARINGADQNGSSNVGGSFPVGTQLQLNANANPLFIGGMDQETDEPFVGDLDEVRVQAVSRPLAWIAAEYRNQKASSTFLSFVDE